MLKYRVHSTEVDSPKETPPPRPAAHRTLIHIRNGIYPTSPETSCSFSSASSSSGSVSDLGTSRSRIGTPTSRLRSTSLSSLSSVDSSDSTDWGYLRVFTGHIKADTDYKTLKISNQTSSLSVIEMILSKFRLTLRDPNLFRLCMELQTRHLGGHVKTILELDDSARPLELQRCHPQHMSRFMVVMADDAVLTRIDDSALCPQSNYKSLLLSRRTTALEAVRLLLQLCRVNDADETNYRLCLVEEEAIAELNYNVCVADIYLNLSPRNTMPPKKAGAKGPKGGKLCVEIPAKTEVPARKQTIVFKNEIGSGGFARVYAGHIKETKEKVAVKVEPSENGCLFVEMKLFQAELSAASLTAYKTQHKLSFLGLPHCIHFGTFKCLDQDLRYIAMPLYHSSLQTYINSRPQKILTYKEVTKFFNSILDAYDYLHSKNVVHADLKAENLMFSINDENNLQHLTLIDFGMAGRRCDETVEKPMKSKAHNGTPHFTSTDAHRGCQPTYRGDYEILGHNLLAWFIGLDNVPWKNYDKKLDTVHKMKEQLIKDPERVEELISDKYAAELVNRLYEVSSDTGYNARVDSSELRLISKSRKRKI